MARFRGGLLSARDAAGELGLSRSRFYVLYADFLRACAQRRQRSWVPGASGGRRHPAWSAEVCALLGKLLRARPPASYSFAACEVHRRHALQLDRASVRRWALAQGLAPDTRFKAPRKPVRRWQVQQVGQLWQYDASPHRWFGEGRPAFHLIEIIDDHSRVVPLARLYPRESLLAHLDFLSTTFAACGLPLALYVDYHSFFFTHQPDAFTQLGAALRFYEVSLRYAPTPQAKGKVEREHQFWQGRLPAYFASEKITELAEANRHIDALRHHHNAKESHRELRQTPQQAWRAALKEKRTVLRPAPACPWWPYVWSVRTQIKVGDDGRVPIGSQRLRLERPPGTKIVLCQHPTGHHSVLAHAPDPKQKPVLLFTNQPK